MNHRPGLERLVTDWLHADATTSGADHVLAAALSRISTTRQERPLAIPRSIDVGSAVRLLVAAAAVVVVIVGIDWLAGGGWSGPAGVGADGSPSATPGPTGSPTPTRSPAPAVVDEGGPLPAGRTMHLIDDIRFSLLAEGWGDPGPEYPSYITRSIRGPQGAEAVISWAQYPGGRSAGMCAYLASRSLVPPSDDDIVQGIHILSGPELVTAMSEVPGTDLVMGPVDVAVGGLPARHLVLYLREDVGCDPGFFFTYPNLHEGALWPETVPGDTIRVWVIEVDDAIVVFEGRTHADAGPGLEQQVEEIIDSIQFE